MSTVWNQADVSGQERWNTPDSGGIHRRAEALLLLAQV
jgi:hypothetical protein